VGRHFHAVRVLRRGLTIEDSKRPLVVYLNHAAWWDPLACLLLSRAFFPSRTAFAPIDAPMLERYGIFRRLGFFGIEPGTLRGARTFLHTAQAILGAPQHALWLTPQGRFSDVRERPLRLASGLGALAKSQPEAMFVPLAIEYPFWTEPRPEMLASFGEPIIPSTFGRGTAREWTRIFAESLTATQDELAAGACRREPGDWITLSRGSSRVSRGYDTWRRLRAWWRGERFIAEHQPEIAE
jgi:1-acyl-sn-glycerol-3-phosphate acyltransferase